MIITFYEISNAYRIISRTKGQVTYVDLLEGMEDC